MTSGSSMRGFLALGCLLTACNNPGGAESTPNVTGTSDSSSTGGSSSTTPESATHVTQFAAFAPQLNAPSNDGSAGSGGQVNVPLGPPYGTSTTCGDSIVGPNEECDDGGEGDDACTAACQTRDQAAVPAAANFASARVLGIGRHPIAGSSNGFAATYMEQLDDEPHVGVTLYDIWGKPLHRLDISSGASPVDEANPVVAALPDGGYAIAWSDFDGDGSDLGVALRRVMADGTAAALASANAGAPFSQLNPDLLWDGTQLVAAWEDYSDPFNGPDLRYRTFDANLNPTSDDQILAGSELPEAAVALAPFKDSWAVAYREGTADGRENIVVRVGADSFRVGPFAGGPMDDRPGLVQLDETHLLLAFSMDPMTAGTSNVPRVRYSVIDVDSPETPAAYPVEADDDVIQRDAQVSELSPSVSAAPDGAYIAWRSEARPGDAAGDQLWLKHVRWVDAGTSHRLADEEAALLLPRSCDENSGDQRTPQLATVPLPPSGALAAAWTDLGRTRGSGASEPEVVVQYAPLRLPSTAPPLTITESWPDATGSTWPANWSSNAAPPVRWVTQYGMGEINPFAAPGSAFAWLNDHTARDVDLTTTVRFSNSSNFASLFARRTDAAPNSYVAAQISTSKTAVWQTYSVAPDPVSGLPVSTTLQSLPLPKGFWNIGVGVNVDYRMRFRVANDASGGVFVGLKVWRLGATEPAAWTLSSVEAAASYVGSQLGGTAGRFGVFAYVPTANGGTIDFDDFSAKFFEGVTSGDLDAASASPLLLPRRAPAYRRCNAGDGNGGTACAVADGCCDLAADCATGLTCDAASAEGLGVGSGASTCVAAHCANRKKDDTETRADCGGADCADCSCTSSATLGAAGYCSMACRCGIGDYPCAEDSDCVSGLVCGVDTGEPFGSAYGVDACVPPHCVNRVLDADQGETLIDCGGDCGTNCAVCSPTNGANGHCRPYCQCGVGEAHCLNDDDCAPPLVCGGSLGTRYGFPAGVSSCVPLHCINNKKDGPLGEWRVDYGGECNTFTGNTLAEAMADFPPLLYRPVSYARDTPELMQLATTTPLTGSFTTPVLRGNNHFVLRSPSSAAVSITLNVGSVPSGAPLTTLTLADFAGTVRKTASVPANASTVVALGTLNGLYEMEIVPDDSALTYSITLNAPVALALKDGAALATPAPLYFYVPAETDTGFLLGNLDTAQQVHFYDPSDVEVTPVHVTDKVYAINTHGKPGVWKTTFATTSLRAHFVNLPDVFSFDRNLVMTSKRIRTSISYGTPPAAPITWQYLRGDNHFVFQLTASASPTFTFAVEDSTMPVPAATVVHLMTISGDELPGSPFSVAPQTTGQLNVGQLAAGDYEFYVASPPSTTRYLITQPAGVSLASVDGFNVGNVWFPAYRNYFYVPADTPFVRFAGASGSTYKVYNQSGTLVAGQPVAKGNGVFEIESTSVGTWALNVAGTTGIRFLNIPQQIAYAPGFQAIPLASPPFACSSNSDCPSGQACGTDNGARFGRPAADDLCWPSTCSSSPAGLCGSTLSPCGTCP